MSMKKYVFCAVFLAVLVSCGGEQPTNPVDPDYKGDYRLEAEMPDTMVTGQAYEIKWAQGKNNKYVTVDLVVPEDSVFDIDIFNRSRTADGCTLYVHKAYMGAVIFEASRHNGVKDTIKYNVVTVGDYTGVPVDMVVGRGGTAVPLKAIGAKHSSLKWHWDLSRLGLGEIISGGDTSVIVDSEYNDTIFLSRINSYGEQMEQVSVAFKTVYAVTFTISTNNAYCFDPIVFAMDLERSEYDFLDSLVLYLPEERLMRLTASNDFSASFDFADTGSFECKLRIYESKGKNLYRDTLISVTVGIAYSGTDVIYELDDRGEDIKILASGRRAPDVVWNWKFSGGENRASATDTTEIYRRPSTVDTVYMWQSKTDTVEGVELVRDAPKVSFLLTTQPKMYVVNTTLIGEGDVNILPSLSFKVQSGRDTILTFNVGENSSVDSVEVNGVSRKLPNNITVAWFRSDTTMAIKMVRADVDVKVYTRRHLSVELLWPKSMDGTYTYNETEYNRIGSGRTTALSLRTRYCGDTQARRSIIFRVNQEVYLSFATFAVIKSTDATTQNNNIRITEKIHYKPGVHMLLVDDFYSDDPDKYHPPIHSDDYFNLFSVYLNFNDDKETFLVQQYGIERFHPGGNQPRYCDGYQEEFEDVLRTVGGR